MTIEIVFETHATTVDNESGVATGWLPGRLSPAGKEGALTLGRRRQDDGLTAVFTSDLRRAVETAEIAFSGVDIPILHDWRLRECDYGNMNGVSAADVYRARAIHVYQPYPGGGESWDEATGRVARFLSDLSSRWDDQRVLIIGHVATRWGLDRFVDGADLR